MTRSLLHQGARHCLFTIQTTKSARSDLAVLRVPTEASRILDGPMQLDKIAARYNLFAASGHCVAALKTLGGEQEPPYGGLITEYKSGRTIHLPADLHRCAEALFHLHNDNEDPDAEGFDLPAIIRKNMRCLVDAPISSVSRQLIEEIKHMALNLTASFYGNAPLMIDAHPGNFIVVKKEGADKVIAVDVESAFKGSPALDLAHLTLYSSSLWRDSKSLPLEARDILDFYKYYAALKAGSNTKTESSALSPTLCLAARRQVLARTLGWMLRLVTNVYHKNIRVPKRCLAAAYNILQADTLRLILDKEEQLTQLWQSQ